MEFSLSELLLEEKHGTGSFLYMTLIFERVVQIGCLLDSRTLAFTCIYLLDAYRHVFL